MAYTNKVINKKIYFKLFSFYICLIKITDANYREKLGIVQSVKTSNRNRAHLLFLLITI